ncbi:MAG: 3-deoxy-D-manno-octulosonic acid transferase [Veillonellaceae bacterium]|jgi:3-deoxy-D-manno-octulosonic-acid transferase|nr:3-deoxy-D-manno-octulosonic acid transferase [Veillonellaceae bacterium]
MHILYNILAVLLVIIAMPVFVFRLIRENGFGERLRQSFGFIPEETLARVAGKGAIWLHAASVGEIVATSPIVKEIRKEIPDAPIMISVVTASGYTMAKRIIKEADAIIFFPIDVPFLGSRVIDRIKPRVFLPVETELWPNFLKSARKHKLPVMMVNGRISDKSVERYRHLGSVLTDMMNTVSRFCMQSDIDKDYILRLGADPSRVVVTGNTKFDQTYTDVSQEQKNKLISEMGLVGSGPVILAGSTHKGEEEIIFRSFIAIKEAFPKAKLVIAPREILRTDEIINLAASHNFTAARRTALQQNPSAGHDVVILDTIGELGKIYSLGDIVFVGGSLIQHGGHNILEPAAHGKPIIVGPNMFNFKDSYFLFSNRGACVTVRDSTELTEQTLKILNNNEIRKAMSDETTAIINENRGAARKSAVYLKELLEAFKY